MHGIKDVSIRTPDQKLRVFVSSTLQELAAERDIVYQAIERMHLIPVLFESGARPHPPQDLYRAYLLQSHIFIGIYWQRYGWIGPGMDISGLEDEFRLSSDMPRLIYIKNPAPDRETGLVKMLGEIKSEATVSYKYFSTIDELRNLVENDLILLLSEGFEHSLDKKLPGMQTGRDEVTNLPPELTRFIGRADQIASVRGLLEKEYIRLLTLTGFGGVGKTRFALKVASEMLDQFADGVWFIELASLTEQGSIVQLIMDRLGIGEDGGRPQLHTLVNYLRDKSLLLILDNCEHIVQSVAEFVTYILPVTKNLRILATSREALGTAGETLWTIPPLNAPNMSEPVELDRLTQYEAVALFIERALAVKPDFTLNEQNAQAVSQICARLDGIPLAIELAAARVRVLSVEDIASRLSDRFHLLVGGRMAIPRQATLRALIDWSYDLLTEKEKILLRRLSIFSGGWAMKAAEAICACTYPNEVQVFDLLTQLVDKSLVIAETQNGIKRYRMLETIRQYGLERLEEYGEANQIAERHSMHFLKIVEDSYGELWGPKQEMWLEELQMDYENLRSALEWTVGETGDKVMLLRMTSSLWHFWEIRGYFSEGRSWLQRALRLNPDGPAALRAHALRGAGILAYQQGDYAQATKMHEESLALFYELGDKLGIGREIEKLGEIAWNQGNYAKAVELHLKSLAIRYEVEDKEGIAGSLGHLGSIARDRGRYRHARALLEESLEASRELGDKTFTAFSLNNLAMVAHLQCDYAQATSLFEEAISLFRQLRNRKGISNTLFNLGHVAKDRGDFNTAVAFYQESLDLDKEHGDQYGIIRAMAGLAEVAIYQGQYCRADELAEESLLFSQEHGIKRSEVTALEIKAFAAYYRGDYKYAIDLANESLELSTEIVAPRAIAYSKVIFGLGAYAQGKQAEAMSLLQEALEIFRNVDDRRNIAHILVNLGRTAYRQGDHESALRFVEESLQISRQLDIRWSLAFSLEIMGLLKRSRSDYQGALDLFLKSLRLSIEQGNQQGIANCLGAIAGLFTKTGQYTRAARLFAAAEKFRSNNCVQLAVGDQLELDGYITLLRKKVKGKEFEKRWLEGLEMTVERLVAEVEDGGDHIATNNGFHPLLGQKWISRLPIPLLGN